ncbi:PREDICTED: jerky protein homolog-like [Polistes dominula]|uniref:Jerky protein homolog-like n=1 Tax=Polistes dominula TaxID=743375 RepID=A0ABM1J4V6_POLDO|nr:PREDICTED: jerky protein homolog-like [Polistes dominula]
MSNKRKHKTLDLKDKMDILKKLDSGENMCKLAKEYGVGRATIHDLKKKKQKIVDHVKTMESGPGKRKTLRVGDCPMMENALYMWFMQRRSKHTPISGEILKAKAIEFYTKITNKDDFRASDGWLDKFKKRFGIRLLTISSEKLSNDESAVQLFIQHFKDKVEELGLLPDQIYNADESGLFWRLLPNKTFVFSKEASTPGRKVIKDRITFMPCSNATGTHKLDLLVIGKVKNPRAFKNICLPVCYKNQFTSWVTREVFNEWFHKDFVPEVKKFMKRSNLPIKALLVLDNAPAHPNEQELKSSDGNIQTIFLPPNCTPLIQPMDQNVIQKVESLYKNKLLIHIISQDGDITQSLKELNLKDVVFSLAHAWKSVSSDLIQSSWKKLWPTMNVVSETEETEEWDPEDNLPITDWLQTLSERGLETSEENLNSWFEGIEETEQIMTDEEICEAVQEEEEEEESLVEILEAPTATTVKVKPDKAFNCFNTCITWAEENGISAKDIIILRNMREKVFKQRLQVAQKQTTIKDYFQTT